MPTTKPTKISAAKEQLNLAELLQLGHCNAVLVFRRELIIAALRRTEGNISQAAILLQMHRNKLSYWIKELGINAGDYKIHRN